MKSLLQKFTRMLHRVQKYLPKINRARGNTLLYIVLVMVIFGMLGATMVSLFTSSTVSTATLNEDRRARYLYESAGRYAMSELRNNNFASDRINDLNSTTHTVSQNGTFDLNIYSLWFRSAVTVNLPMGDPLLRLNTEEGEIPDEIIGAIPSGSIYVVNIESTETDFAGNLVIPANHPNSTAIVNGIIKDSATQYRIGITEPSDNTFSVNADDRVCFAVRPTTFQSLSAGSNLKVHQHARFIFPKTNGIVYIKTKPVLYEKAVYIPGSRVELTNISQAVTISSAEYVVLWPGNHSVMPSATAENVTYDGKPNDVLNVADTGDLTLGKYGSPEPDIDADEFTNDLTQKEDPTKTTFIEVDTTDDALAIGDASGPVFGGAWYDADKSVGGVTNFCSAGNCILGLGIRAFFTFEKTGNGNGFIFSLINGLSNDSGSIGGDITAAELLGYAGDSRLVPNPGPPPSADFLDGTGEGLQAPKIGLEFDTIVNYDAAFEANQLFCSGASLNLDTRNDPLEGTSQKDAVQLVYWGRDFVDLSACRNTPGRDTYDDNRHNALGYASGNWSSNLFSNVRSSPTVGPNGTIFVGSDNDRLYAIDPADGSKAWQYSTSGEVRTQPALSSDGSIVYATCTNGNLYAINASNGNLQWSEPLGAATPSGPALDSAGFIYVSAGTQVLKIDPAEPSAPKPSFSVAGNPNVRSAPVLNGDGSRVYVIFEDDELYALNSFDLTLIWHRPASGSVGSPAVHPFTGDIYVSVNTGMNQWGSDGTFKGSYGFGSNVSSAPVISLDGSAVYVGYSNGVLAARDAAGIGPLWTFVTGNSQPIVGTPAVDGSGHVYFGSDDNRVYAVFGDGRLKWNFSTGGDVRTSPAIGANGTVYAGSDDNQLWAIDEFAEPRNYRQNTAEVGQKLIAYNEADALNPYPAGFIPTDSNDWIKSGPWAVRLDVSRSTLGDGSGDYVLRAWMYQCGNNDCSDILGTFFENTRTNYNPSNIPPQLVQTFNLDNGINPDFDTFLFGFTSASDSGDTQLITIKNFQLSFIRPNDVVRTDPFTP